VSAEENKAVPLRGAEEIFNRGNLDPPTSSTPLTTCYTILPYGGPSWARMNKTVRGDAIGGLPGRPRHRGGPDS
jgi:hypothetical protein